MVLYSSRVRWAVVTLGAAILVGGFGIVLIVDGPGPVPVAGFVLGVMASLVVALDQPRRVEFGPDAIVRVCPLRTHRIAWDEVVALERLRRGGGLVARCVGGRRVVLVDRREGRVEHECLVALVGSCAPGVAVSADEPAVDARPTDLYRRPRDRSGGR